MAERAVRSRSRSGRNQELSQRPGISQAARRIEEGPGPVLPEERRTPDRAVAVDNHPTFDRVPLGEREVMRAVQLSSLSRRQLVAGCFTRDPTANADSAINNRNTIQRYYYA